MKPFEEVFDAALAPTDGLRVRQLRLQEQTLHMELVLHTGDKALSDAQKETLAEGIRAAYELNSVHITAVRDERPADDTKLERLKRERRADALQADSRPNLEELEAKREAFLREAASRLPVPSAKHKSGKKRLTGPVLLGRALKGEPVPMESLDGDSGKVIVRGTVFGTDSRKTKKGYLLSFALTDLTSSVRVTRFFRDADEGELVGQAVHKGLYLMVQGKMEWDTRREWEEPVLRPDNIFKCDNPVTPRQDEAPRKRVELHLHTRMSDMDATTEIRALLACARDWGHSAVAITDHGVLHAYPDAMNVAADISKGMKKEGKEGLKILYGCEAYYVGDGLSKGDKKRAWHMILLARDSQGLRGLYEITTRAHLDFFHYHPTVPKTLLAPYRAHLVVGSACEAGELFSAIVAGKSRPELLDIARYYDFLEIQPLCNNAFLCREGKTEEDLIAYNRMVVSLGEELQIPVVATGDVHFLHPEDEIYRKILLASKGMESAYPLPLYFRTTEEMLAEFAYLGEQKAQEVVIDNTNLVAGWCEPLQPIPRGKFFPPRIEGSAEQLRELAFSKAYHLYGDPLPSLLEERIHTELDPIIRKGYDVIYMTAQKLVAKSLSEGYLVGSRGSVGSSIVAFLAGITEVNALPPHYRCPRCRHSDFPEAPEGACGADLPVKTCPVCATTMDRDGFDIPFATFLGFDADKKPDIDLNFSGEYQARAHQHTVELFGEDKVFRAGTIATVAEKTAIGFVRKYMEENHLTYPPAEVERLALGCTGVRRTTGQHPGGLIVVPEENDIHEFCPVQHPANKKESGVVTTHFDYHSIEDNLLKLDLLGHDDPTMIRRMEEITGIDAQTIPLDDADTMSLYSSSAVLGYENDSVLGPTGACALPEFGTRFVREMLCMTKPTTFDELVRICGLSHGTDVWLGNAADLIRDGKATLKDVVCARDDITTFLIAKGLDRKQAFFISESVRKGKGVKPEWEEAMLAAGVPAWYVQSCQKIQYMFPKAHAVAYCLMSFRVAYFKTHHPLAFYSAYFSIRANALEVVLACRDEETIRRRAVEILRMPKTTPADDDKLTTLEVCLEFLRRGFSFLPIDLYRSDAVRFTLEPGGLRIPFMAIAGLGERAASDIMEQRGQGAFVSAEELLSRCRGLNSTHVAQLKALGALGDLPDSTQLSFFG